jgi:hypothetical protein
MVNVPMATDQPGVAGVVIAFVARPQRAVYLTPHDRMDLNAWREAARAAGYDRMNIHEREDGEAGEFGDFLCLYRRGEPWSRCGFARKSKVISVWCCVTGADIGEFPSMATAFAAVLPGATPKPSRPQRTCAVITALRPRVGESANRLGSAD